MRPAPDTRDPALRWSRALAHPLRGEILKLLVATAIDSPSGIAAALGTDFHRVSYHVRRLEDLALIELRRRTTVRGAIKHHYRLADRAATIRALERSEDLVRLSTGSDPDRELLDARRLKALGQVLRRRQATATTTTAALAARAGTSEEYLERIEQGAADPPCTLLLRLADALDCTVFELVSETMQTAAEPATS